MCKVLETKINNLSEELSVIRTSIKLESITHYHFDNVDLLITTHDIPKQTLNILPKHLTTIKVAPLFSEDDRHKNQTRCEAKAKSSKHIIIWTLSISLS